MMGFNSAVWTQSKKLQGLCYKSIVIIFKSKYKYILIKFGEKKLCLINFLYLRQNAIYL